MTLAVGAAAIGCTGYLDGNASPGLGASNGNAGSASVGPGVDPGAGPAACNPGAVQVGGTPLQRLTREQYANSVRDLLGGSEVPLDNVTPDEKFGTFAANVTAGLTDLGVDQYMRSAEAAVVASLAKAKWDVLVPCDHAALGDEACAGQFIQKFGLRAYRRPLTTEEATRYTALYKSFASSGYDNGVRVVAEAMLQSPNFLYRVEVGSSGTPDADATPLTQYELASRLAFFLWNSTPDDELLSTAGATGLSDQKSLKAQAGRLLADARARDTFASFHTQWLDLQGVASLSKNPNVYPDYSNELGAAMAKETIDFADYVLRKGDGKLKTLLTASFTVADDTLLRLYGATRPANQGAQEPVTLDPAQRSGILTQAGFLASHAHSNQSSLVQRGRVVRMNVLCEQLPAAPPNVDTTPPDPTADATTRQRFVQHESDPICGGCHKLIDGIGFGFENFDGIGRFRQQDASQPVDVSGQFVGTGDLDGTFNGPVELVKKLASSVEVQHCVASQWFEYALGRTRTDADACSLRAVQASFDGSGQDLRQLLIDIVSSDSFRYRSSIAGEAP